MLVTHGTGGGRISTHALLAEGDHPPPTASQEISQISTHALLAEGDARESWYYVATDNISTHALLAEGDTTPPDESWTV